MSGYGNHRVGDLRPSQILFTFGVGASIDLPNLAVMVMGVDQWPAVHCREINEARLLAAVQEQLGGQVRRLLEPPRPDKEPKSPLDPDAGIGMPVRMFPRWLRCPQCQLMAPLESGLFELKPNPYRPDQTRWVHTSCPKNPGRSRQTAVPVRFLVACRNGHLDDFPWVEFVHGGPTSCRSVLRMMQFGVSDSVADVVIKCETCDQSRRMIDAFDPQRDNPLMPLCDCYHPHLENTRSTGSCVDQDNQPLRMEAILLGASNSWFPINLSALAVPVTGVSQLAQLVEDHWLLFEQVTSPTILAAFRGTPALQAVLQPFEDFDDAAIWQQVQAKRDAQPADDDDHEDLKTPEWRAFVAADPKQNTDDFRLQQIQVPQGYDPYFEQVVLLHRLREARALVGFTRIQAAGEFGEEWRVPAERRAPLGNGTLTWVPAAEVRGEGVFIRFREDALATWLARPDVRALEQTFLEAHRRWRAARNIAPPSDAFPGMRFVLLHSFAHVLMRQLALECGYTSASVRERIYAADAQDDAGPMAGVLIYTAASDSEGTLGGLVAQGEPQILAYHLDQALKQAELCTSDPLCADHHPFEHGTTLHGAACHACTFSPETSCERGNKYLDRRVLVQTLNTGVTPFFG
ncbi:MAG: DUF1998 domain-containing protein [Thiohalocapsa sp. PB-PSB1]|mgnify:CR=1 FL=1|jgi:hypothetical protein|nr:MAG: hypothetical protein N838_07095 [Thiohalocapsa sp. PB-PSB1]QQO53244.1 MAG: DUF1998 domain-containing protein [Thiohalocapsa sp. PB-PSB1]